MIKAPLLLIAASIMQAADAPERALALPEHKGQLTWTADGFETVQWSAKPNGRELGLRGRNAAGLTFLGFLFLFPEEAPMTSAKCRDGVMGPELKANRNEKIVDQQEIHRDTGSPLTIVATETKTAAGKMLYYLRGFVADGDVCGDMEVYDEKPVTMTNPAVKKIFETLTLNEGYLPHFKDTFLYATLLFNSHQYQGAGPLYELALAKLKDEPASAPKDTKRVLIDQAGMSYGMSGKTAKARALFTKAIADDPDYPMYYYNLACADAEEGKLQDAKKHLEAAFARKANTLKNEPMPRPTEDDSFTRYRSNKEFWQFLASLR